MQITIDIHTAGDEELLDREFTREFNRLEKLCNEMYDDIHGVSRYLKEMENVDSALSNAVPEWKDTYRTLKHVRWARNKLVHEEEVHYTREDIQWLKEFYQKMMDGEDPLSMSEKMANRKGKMTPARKTGANDNKSVSMKKKTAKSATGRTTKKATASSGKKVVNWPNVFILLAGLAGIVFGVILLT